MDTPATYRPRCLFLTCKSMLVWGENFQDDPEYQAGMVEFTCNQTMRATGPDGENASLDACSDPARPCFREF
jgi:hypothetical protein